MKHAPMRLVLPRPLIERLESAGVYCQTWLTVERQSRTKQWVLRGIESGGSAKECGRYVGFFDLKGHRLSWLQRMDRITGNGAHAVVIADSLVSVEMARVDATFQLLIVSHRLREAEPGKRPELKSDVVFRGIDGQLPHELRQQGLVPEFFTRSGEVKPIPDRFLDAVRLVTAGASCVNCRHCHALLERQNTPVE